MKTRIWIVAVADRGVVEHVRPFATETKAQKDLAAHLRRYHDYPGSHRMEQISAWLDQHSERLSAQIVCESLDLGEVTSTPKRSRTALSINPPPDECSNGDLLYRVVYAIDVPASDPRKAAETAHHFMVDTASMLPVLEIIDPKGRLVTIDLSKESKAAKP